MYSWIISLFTFFLSLVAPIQGPDLYASTQYELSMIQWPVAAPLHSYDLAMVGATSYNEVQQVDLPQVPPITYNIAYAIARLAGWHEDLIPSLLIIARCEAGTGDAYDSWLFYPGETGDSGRSLGWLQLNEGHFPRAAAYGAVSLEESLIWWDPTVNAKVALWLYNARGQRFAGGGGWTCADKQGIFP